MSSDPNPFSKHRALFGGACLATLAGFLAIHHQNEDSGLSAQEITPELVADLAGELGGASATQPNRWLLDFVEPEDGEGGSESEIRDLVAKIDTVPGTTVVPAGFYSEGEHLYRLETTGPGWQRLESLLDDPLLEGVEAELYYSLPANAASAADAPIDDADDPEASRPPRFQPDDPMFGLQWHMEQINAPQAWTQNRGAGAVVAVIDTGVAWKSSEGVKQLPDLAGTSFTPGETFISGLPEGLDDHAHGSHVAGTIAQTTDNGIGVTGVAFESTIMPLKVLSKDGRGSVGGIANAIRYAADHGATVINMSLGGPLPSRVLAKAIEYAHEKGVTTVCAAGNEHRGRVGYPAANKFAVAVSAVDFERNLTFYSNWGKDIDVAAPGGDTRADKNGDGHPDGVLQNTIEIGRPLENDYLWFQGTSMASPHAAGVAALIVASGVTNPDEVERVMKDTAVHPNNETWDKKYGAGVIDANGAVKSAHAGHTQERWGLAGLLGLAGLGGLGFASAGRRRRWLGVAGFVGGLSLGAGVLGVAPLAYGLASVGGGIGAILGFGSPLWMSALLPLALTLVMLSIRPARALLAGLALGYAGMLLHGAVVLPTLLTELPGGPFVDRLWLGANALVAFWLARRIVRLK